MKPLRSTFTALALLGATVPASAQFFPPRPPASIPQITSAPLPPPTATAPSLQKKSAKADCNAANRYCIPKPELVAAPNMLEGRITIQDDEKFLYLGIGNGKAMRYKIATAIEREKMPRGDYILSSERGGEPMAGGQLMYGMARKPRWCPTDNIRLQRNLPKGCMEGGIKANPFGVAAFYLAYLNNNGKEAQTLFRIHGTNQPEKIGENVSSGCVRMLNEDVSDLFDRVMDIRLRNIQVSVYVPQGPTREEYRENQKLISAQVQEEYYDRQQPDPNYYPDQQPRYQQRRPYPQQPCNNPFGFCF